MQELLALVRFNDSVGLVMKEEIKLTYNKYDDCIIGRDESGVFFNCLFYERPIGKWKAFAGREFDIHLEDGEIVHCNGQWWSGMNETSRKIINQDLVGVTANDIESLKRCYVFTGYTGFKEEYQKLVDSYDGKIYEYREYEDIIKNR